MNSIEQNSSQFDFTYAPGTSREQIIGFEMAGAIWSSYIQDNVTIRIYVESSSMLPDNLVGAALPGKKKKVDYDKLWEEMSRDITSSEDVLAFNNLPSTDDRFSVLVDGIKLDKTKEFRLTNANAKALDLLDDDRKKLDGYIVVNDLAGSSTAGWDYDALRSGNPTGNTIDFLSVAMHEIGHVLGFVSGIDDDGWLKVLSESRIKGKEIKEDDFKFAAPLDLFRYSDKSAARGELDISTGGNPFFSIDGGRSKLGDFANGEHTDFGGDGYQASHWKQYSDRGIMNPVLSLGQRRDISALDLTAMDVIGWNINSEVVLDWENLYAEAVANSNSAIVTDRSKDVKKMVDESKYDVRRSRSSSRFNYSWQMGLWQYTTWQPVDNPEEIVEEEDLSGENSDTAIPVYPTDIPDDTDDFSEDNWQVDNNDNLNTAPYPTSIPDNTDDSSENNWQVDNNDNSGLTTTSNSLWEDWDTKDENESDRNNVATNSYSNKTADTVSYYSWDDWDTENTATLTVSRENEWWNISGVNSDLYRDRFW